MTRFSTVKKLKPEVFRRLTGVKITTFQKMVEVLKKAEIEKKKFGGKPSKLCIQDKLLMTLEYLREYRTYLHISVSYGVSSSAVCRTIRWTEDALIRAKEFSLPSKKALQESEIDFEVVIVDATETPIERPKKNKKNTTQARKKDIL
jgi:hypothetical protein